MRNFILSCLSVALLSSPACKTKAPSAANQNSQNEIILSDKLMPIIKDRDLFAATTELIPIDTCYISGNEIVIHTAKLNACTAQNFTLLWNGSLAKSLPPKVTLKLLLRADTECKEYHKFHLRFNLQDLKNKDQNPGGTVIVRIGGYQKELPCQL